jgi:quinol monooxygenase YgiN|tara:strand:- start:761 stop:1135 length:375 start_codon:yes stop_codon:yes gene_type:complete
VSISTSDTKGTPIAMSDDIEIELVVITMTFDANQRQADNEELLAILSKYIVLTRMADGCRNVDLCSSITTPGRHLVIQKWDSGQMQRQHFDSPLMVEMATSCSAVLASAPEIDMWEGTSAHDLR